MSKTLKFLWMSLFASLIMGAIYLSTFGAPAPSQEVTKAYEINVSSSQS